MTFRNAINAFEESFVQRGVLESQIRFERFFIQLFLKLRMLQKGLDFTTNDERIAIVVIIHRLNPKEVAGTKHFFLVVIPNQESKHAANLFQQFFNAILFVTMKQHLGVGMGLKHMSGSNQIFANTLKIIDFPIKDNRNSTVFVQNRLRTTL